MHLYTFHVDGLQQLLASPVTFAPGNPVSQQQLEVDGLLIRRIVANDGIKLEFVSGGKGHWNTVLQYRRGKGHPVGIIDYQHKGTCRFTDPTGQEAQLAQGLVDALASQGYAAPRYESDIVKEYERKDYWQEGGAVAKMAVLN